MCNMSLFPVLLYPNPLFSRSSDVPVLFCQSLLVSIFVPANICRSPIVSCKSAGSLLPCLSWYLWLACKPPIAPLFVLHVTIIGTLRGAFLPRLNILGFHFPPPHVMAHLSMPAVCLCRGLCSRLSWMVACIIILFAWSVLSWRSLWKHTNLCRSMTHNFKGVLFLAKAPFDGAMPTLDAEEAVPMPLASCFHVFAT